MRQAMYDFFSKPRTPAMSSMSSMSCLIEKNNDYWDWRLNSVKKPTQAEIEDTAYKSYDIMASNAIMTLCPKGNGNSSMRIVEALGCGSIPILIDDFSAPFGVSWEEAGIALSFDTRIHTWEYIYSQCNKLLNDRERLEKMQKKGQEYFKTVIYGDSRAKAFKMYDNLDTVAFGFGGKILEILSRLKNT